MEDKDILDVYMQGWNDEAQNFDNRTIFLPREYINPVLQRAYNIGRDHFILGDDNKSFDSMTDEEILNLIKDDK